jgi:hypothetical protein
VVNLAHAHLLGGAAPFVTCALLVLRERARILKVVGLLLARRLLATSSRIRMCTFVHRLRQYLYFFTSQPSSCATSLLALWVKEDSVPSFL